MLRPEQLETRRLMAVLPMASVPLADVPASTLPAQVIIPQVPGASLTIPSPTVSLGTMLEDGSFLIRKSRLLAGARSLLPTAIDVQNLSLVQGSGTITQQTSGDWLFRPAANWFGEARFSYTVVTRGQGSYRTIDGLDPASYTSPVQNGSAKITPLGLVLTTTGYQYGSAYLASKIDLTRDFSTTFRLNLSGGTGGDGVAFIIHNDRRGAAALGTGGGGMGYYGIERSVGVEFDTYVGGHAADTMVGRDHVGIQVNGTEVIDRQSFPGFDLRSGPVYAWVDYQASTSTLRVFVSRFEGKPATPLFTVVRNLATQVGSDGFIGFTGATGYYHDVQVVQAWTVRSWTAGGAAVPGTATLTVRPVNDPPVAGQPVNLGWAMNGQTVRITVAQLLANTTDVDGDVLSIRNLRVAGGARLTATGDGSWSFSANVRQVTTFTLWYDVTDGRSSVRTSATIVVSPLIIALPNPPIVPRPIPLPMPLPAGGVSRGAGLTVSAVIKAP